MKPKVRGWFLAVLGILALPLPALTHHAFPAEFDVDKPVTLTGIVSRLEWVNPHVYVFLDVKDDKGKLATWSLESWPTGILHRSGVARQSITVGTPLTILAYRAKDGSNLAYIRKFTWADGHAIETWFGGREPGRPPAP
jgi:Family of unknown function (DUF6152)